MTASPPPRETATVEQLLPANVRRVVTTDAVRLLSRAEQDAYVEMLARGQAELAACVQLRVTLEDVLTTQEAEPRFEHLVRLAWALRSSNIVSIAYRDALAGKGAAQSLLLRGQPPDAWRIAAASPPTADALDELTDDELDHVLRKTEKDFQNSRAAGGHAAGRAETSGRVPPADPTAAGG